MFCAVYKSRCRVLEGGSLGGLFVGGENINFAVMGLVETNEVIEYPPLSATVNNDW